MVVSFIKWYMFGSALRAFQNKIKTIIADLKCNARAQVVNYVV